MTDDLPPFLTARLKAAGPTVTKLFPAVVSPSGRRRVVAVSHSHLHSLTTGPHQSGALQQSEIQMLWTPAHLCHKDTPQEIIFVVF